VGTPHSLSSALAVVSQRRPAVDGDDGGDGDAVDDDGTDACVGIDDGGFERSCAWAHDTSSTMASVCAQLRCVRDDNNAHMRGTTVEGAATWTAVAKQSWWRERQALDQRMADAIAAMQHALGFRAALLCGVVLSRAAALHIRTATSAATAQLRALGARVRQPALLARVVEASPDILTVSEVAHGLRTACTFPVGVDGDAACGSVAAAIVPKLQAAVGATDTPLRRGHVTLILSDEIAHLPWENLPCMRSNSVVSRSPCLPMVLAAVSAPSSVSTGPQLRLVYAVNPSGDLKRTEEAMQPLLKQLRDASHIAADGVSGHVAGVDAGPVDAAVTATHAASDNVVSQLLSRSDVYLYCGHGAGAQLVAREHVETRCSQLHTALLMGCSSALLTREGVFDADGPAMAYVVGGTRCVLGNLWDVTDMDADRATVALVTAWLLATPTPLTTTPAASIPDARLQCKLRHLTGAALVCYAAPTAEAPLP
jgi:hypothetical protein